MPERDEKPVVIDDAEVLDRVLGILRKHRVAEYEGRIGMSSVRMKLRDELPPSITEQLKAIPGATPEEMDAILFHSAPEPVDSPRPSAPMQAK